MLKFSLSSLPFCSKNTILIYCTEQLTFFFYIKQFHTKNINKITIHTVSAMDINNSSRCLLI